MRKTLTKEYRDENGTLSAAYSVELGSEDGTYGIKTIDGTVLVADSSPALNPSLGVYTYQFEAAPETIFWVSWKIYPNQGDTPEYYVTQVGPFEDPTACVRASTDIRGKFIPTRIGTIFLRVSNFEGYGVGADDIVVDVLDSNANTVVSGVPETVDQGFYAWDWNVPYGQPHGEYYAQWTYSIQGMPYTDMQKLIVIEPSSTPNAQFGSFLYGGRVVEMRQALSAMISTAQAIPVYREPAKPTHDMRTFSFTFPRWNSTAGVRVYRNDNLVTTGFTINHFRGNIVFDNPLTQYDRVEVGYNFRWYTDEQLDRFMSNAVHLLNITTPVTNMNLPNLDEKWIAIVLYGAAVDAIRNLMLSLQFQEPQLVFGGAERADKVFSNLEALKKNYEETWKYGLEQKKLGPYKGLTRFMTTPEFAMPGGRSRMFRYLFSGGV